MGKEVREAEIMGSEMVETQGCRPSVLSAGCQTTGSTLSCGEKASAAFASAASATAETKTTSNHAASAASREESSNLPGSAPNIGENRNGVAPSALSDITTKPGPACENQQDCQDNQLRIPGAKKSLRKAEDGSKIPIPENVKLIRKLGEGVFAMVSFLIP